MKALKHILTAMLALLPTALLAQEEPGGPLSPEEEEKKFYEAIEDQLDKYTEQLKLAEWQVFYLDSILVSDFKGMRDELKQLGEAKVTNPDLYIMVQDKWTENTYNAIHKILNEQQWNKYLKMGAARSKKARDKRAGKKEEKK
ncbi:MAG: hypothetical protein J5771_02835 [Bacteroidales bacterium]|nr:hypothetical protein [Bacteroidales bacterium]